MNRRSFIAWGLRFALAAQVCGSDLVDLAGQVLPEAEITWFVKMAGATFYPELGIVEADSHLSGRHIETLGDGWFRLSATGVRATASMFVKDGDAVPSGTVILVPDGTTVGAYSSPLLAVDGHLEWGHQLEGPENAWDDGLNQPRRIEAGRTNYHLAQYEA